MSDNTPDKLAEAIITTLDEHADGVGLNVIAEAIAIALIEISPDEDPHVAGCMADDIVGYVDAWLADLERPRAANELS